VDNLELPVPGEGLGIRGEPGRVPAVVSSELTGEVRRGVLGERAQEFGSVGTIPEKGQIVRKK
jgi:hypothetical protein